MLINNVLINAPPPFFCGFSKLSNYQHNVVPVSHTWFGISLGWVHDLCDLWMTYHFWINRSLNITVKDCDADGFQNVLFWLKLWIIQIQTPAVVISSWVSGWRGSVRSARGVLVIPILPLLSLFLSPSPCWRNYSWEKHLPHFPVLPQLWEMCFRKRLCGRDPEVSDRSEAMQNT